MIEGGGVFPSELSGTWVCEEQDWTIVLDKNGYIPYVIIPMGKTELHPGRETRFSIPKYKGQAIYKPGLWTVNYSPDGKELGVTFEIEYFYQDVGNHAIEGSTKDYLFGKVSEDGLIWKADLHTSAIIDALFFEGWTLKERKPLIEDIEPVYRGEVIFQKQKL